MSSPYSQINPFGPPSYPWSPPSSGQTSPVVPTGSPDVPQSGSPFSSGSVLWGWVSNPLRIAKLVAGFFLMMTALWLAFKDNPLVQATGQAVLYGSTGGIGALGAQAAGMGVRP